ncbi:mCG50171, partial [Mus musculus]
FAKKHNKKGLKKMQANNAKAVSACAEAIKALVRPQAINPKMSKGPSHKLSRLAFIAHPKLGKQIRSYMAKGRPTTAKALHNEKGIFIVGNMNELTWNRKMSRYGDNTQHTKLKRKANMGAERGMRFSLSGGMEGAGWQSSLNNTKLLASSDLCERPTKTLSIHSIGTVLSRVPKGSHMVTDLPFCTDERVAHNVESSLSGKWGQGKIGVKQTPTGTTPRMLPDRYKANRLQVQGFLTWGSYIHIKEEH